MPSCWITWALTCEAAETLGQRIADDIARQKQELGGDGGDGGGDDES